MGQETGQPGEEMGQETGQDRIREMLQPVSSSHVVVVVPQPEPLPQSQCLQ